MVHNPFGSVYASTTSHTTIFHAIIILRASHLILQWSNGLTFSTWTTLPSLLGLLEINCIYNLFCVRQESIPIQPPPNIHATAWTCASHQSCNGSDASKLSMWLKVISIVDITFTDMWRFLHQTRGHLKGATSPSEILNCRWHVSSYLDDTLSYLVLPSGASSIDTCCHLTDLTILLYGWNSSLNRVWFFFGSVGWPIQPSLTKISCDDLVVHGLLISYLDGSTDPWLHLTGIVGSPCYFSSTLDLHASDGWDHLPQLAQWVYFNTVSTQLLTNIATF